MTETYGYKVFFGFTIFGFTFLITKAMVRPRFERLPVVNVKRVKPRKNILAGKKIV